eukprot:1143177-Pelagomonas_calceolata.AAC.2
MKNASAPAIHTSRTHRREESSMATGTHACGLSCKGQSKCQMSHTLRDTKHIGMVQRRIPWPLHKDDKQRRSPSHRAPCMTDCTTQGSLHDSSAKNRSVSGRSA